jgi:hypothetical protein
VECLCSPKPYAHICALLSFLVSSSLWGRENNAISSTGTALKGVCVCSDIEFRELSNPFKDVTQHGDSAKSVRIL